MTQAKAKATTYKCPECGLEYEDADVVCVGKAEAGHPNEPAKVQPAKASAADADDAAE